MKVYYITQVLKQCININTNCPNQILEFRYTKSHFCKSIWARGPRQKLSSKIMSVKLLVVIILVHTCILFSAMLLFRLYKLLKFDVHIRITTFKSQSNQCIKMVHKQRTGKRIIMLILSQCLTYRVHVDLTISYVLLHGTL